MINKMWYIYMCVSVCMCVCVLFSHQKEWNLSICDSKIDLEVYYTKWNKSDRDRQIQNDFTYTHISVYEYSIYLCTESTKQNKWEIITK